ncbi:MAG TPA: SseB family protein [Micromonosporaceae bacterium]|jgi:hypothetical protein|nr:SseB family protein [Micromonosporaceae bacterium]
MTGDAVGWRPANDTELALMNALAAGDRRGYFRILRTVPLYLPLLASEGDDPGAQRFVTARLFGITFLPVFTSVEGMSGYVGDAADAYTVTGYAELRDKWPVADWRLAVAPGSPLEAYLPVESVEAAAVGELEIPTAAQALGAASTAGSAPRASDVDSALTGAAAGGDARGYLDTLLGAQVFVPTAEPVDGPERLLEPDFPFAVAGTAQAPAIEVFTSIAPIGARPAVEVPFIALLTVWPDRHALLVNPGTPHSIELPADEVPLLLLWPQETG